MKDKTEVHFNCPVDLADYAYQVMREHRLESVAAAWRLIAMEHQQWYRRRTLESVN